MAPRIPSYRTGINVAVVGYRPAGLGHHSRPTYHRITPYRGSSISSSPAQPRPAAETTFEFVTMSPSLTGQTIPPQTFHGGTANKHGIYMKECYTLRRAPFPSACLAS